MDGAPRADREWRGSMERAWSEHGARVVGRGVWRAGACGGQGRVAGRGRQPLTGELLGLLVGPLAVARAAVLLDDSARAPARRAARLLLHPPQDRVHRLHDHPTAAARGARVDRRPRRHARAGARPAGLKVRDADFLRATEERRLEVDLQVEAQVVPLRRTRPPPPAAAATLASEEGFKDVADVEILHAGAGAAGARAAHAGDAKLVVPRPHLRVREHRVRLVDRLELLLRTWLLVDVRVPFARGRAVGLFDVGLGGAA